MNDKRKRGRKSAASLGVVVSVTGEPARPAPPAELTADEAEIWKAVVEDMPADWFGRPTWPLLVQYCRHADTARDIERLFREHEAGELDLPRYNRLLVMRARESAALIRLARCMRLTQQSRIDPRTAGRKVAAVPKADPPWLPSTPPHLTEDRNND